MKIVEKIKVATQNDLIYLKYRLKQLKELPDRAFYLLAAGELGTNILKYAQEGTIYILQSDVHYILAAFDYGKGIENLQWAMKRGTTTSKNSLGLGLYQLSQSENFHFEIYSSTKKDMHGTVALLYPKNFDPKILFFSDPYLNENNNGDFFAKKGKFLLFGDASGHSSKSHATSELIKKEFYKSVLSCVITEEFFKHIHSIIKEKGMRSAVFCILEVLRNSVQICGVGNISIWHMFEDTITYHSLKEGIVGERISSISKIVFQLNDKILLTTDGIEKRKANRLLKELLKLSPIMIVFAIFHFCKVHTDDTSLLIISKEKKRTKSSRKRY